MLEKIKTENGNGSYYLPKNPDNGAETAEYEPDYNKRAQFTYSTAGTDGVSLQIIEDTKTLKERGEKVYWISSDKPADQAGIEIPLMNFRHPIILALNRRLFPALYESIMPPNPTEVQRREINRAQNEFDEEYNRISEKYSERVAAAQMINKLAAPLEAAISEFIIKENIGVLTARNIFSLPLNLPLSYALYKLIKSGKVPGLKTEIFNHDYYWDPNRAPKYITNIPELHKFMRFIMPPVITDDDELKNKSGALSAEDALYIHINGHVKSSFLERMPEGTEKYVNIINDGYDFEKTVEMKKNMIESGKTDELRKLLGISEDTIMVTVPSRILSRKAFETAIRLVSVLNKQKKKLADIAALPGLNGRPQGFGLYARPFTENSEIILVCTQEKDTDPVYLESLRELADEYGVKMKFAGKYVHSDAEPETVSRPIPHELSNAGSDLVIIPSAEEGFGNQVLEAMPWIVPVLFENDGFAKNIKGENAQGQMLPHIFSLGNTYSLIEKSGRILRWLPGKALYQVVDRIIEQYRDPEELRRKVEDNLKYAKQRWDSRIIAEKHRRITEKLIGTSELQTVFTVDKGLSESLPLAV